MSDTTPAPAPAENAAPASPDTTAPPAAALSSTDWRAGLPDELKADPSIQKFNDPAALAKSYVEAQKLIGRKGVILPGENATPEEQAQFRAALGVPEKAEGYDLKAPEGLPDGVWDDGHAQAFAGKAHELGLTPAQVRGLAEWQAQAMAKVGEAAALEPDGRTWQDTLKGEWGDGFDGKLALAQRAAKQFGDAPALAAMEAKAGGAAMVRMFARIGAALGEDAPAGMNAGGAGTPGDAKAQASAIVADRAGPYWNPLHPQHRETVQQVTRLLAAAG